MKAAIILFPGSNRERDAARAVETVTGGCASIVWHTETELPAVDLIVLPGGFSYGDYLRAGAIAARSPVMRDVARKAEAGVPVLGICNGFQILTEAGLLPGALMRNGHLKFTCSHVGLRVERNDTPFTRKYAPGQIVRFPIAHHDGAYFADPDTLDRLEGDGRVVFRYASGENPNGAERDIAGIVNARRNVLGLMPHPENMIDPALGGTDGRGIFESVFEGDAIFSI